MEQDLNLNEYLHNPSILWYDTETTGLYNKCAICELYVEIEQKGKIVYNHEWKARPFSNSWICKDALKLLGLTRKQLWDYPDPAIMYNELLEVLYEYKLEDYLYLPAGHKISYDLRMLKHGLEHIGKSYDELIQIKNSFCTLSFTKRMRKLGVIPPGSNALTEVAKTLGFQLIDAHTAKADTQMSRKVGYELIRLKQEWEQKQPQIINEFKGEYWFLSNYSKSPITIKDKVWPTIEHIFQASKSLYASKREKIRKLKKPGDAKRVGKKVELRKDWEQVKEKIMRKVIMLKFSQNTDLRQKLLETGDKILIEGNTWHDNEWGDCSCSKCKNIKGKNKLGKILMSVRDELRKS